MEKNKIYFGNCLNLMMGLPDNSIDCCVTDPPYGIRFMGKKWDYEIPAIATWEEVYRVMKPGGHIEVACGTRTQHRMVCNIEDAGFEIRDVIAWHYGSGFPKSMNISKAIDKKSEENQGAIFAKIECGKWLRKRRIELNLSTKQVAEHFPSITGGITGCVSNWEGGEIPTWEHFSKIKAILSLGNEYDYLIKDRPDNYIAAEREVIGQCRPGFHAGSNRVYGQFSGDGNITASATDAAKQWEGWGTALKPATEFWTLARKPISEGTVAANILRWGVGGLNIDACRIPFQNEEDFKSATYGTGTNIIGGNYAGGKHKIDSDRKKLEANRKGRFPANVILDDFMAEEMDRQSGQLTSGQPVGKDSADTKSKHVYGKFAGGRDLTGYGDTGGASRFFYVAKPSSEERGGSSHPTIKPQELIQYLIKLICPIEPGRTVLEPFAGSGAHCIAARKLGLDFYAAEIGEKECREANDRLAKEMGLFA